MKSESRVLSAFVVVAALVVVVFCTCKNATEPVSPVVNSQGHGGNSALQSVQIFFMSGQESVGALDIYSMNADGSNQKNLTESSFNERVFEVDKAGNQLYYVVHLDHSDEIFKMNMDGSDKMRLTDDGSSISFKRDLRLSPNGDYLYYTGAFDGFSDVWDVYRIGKQGGVVENLTRGRAGSCRIADVSSDGSLALLESTPKLFQGNADIVLLNTMTCKLSWLTQNAGYNYYPRFSPPKRQTGIARVINFTRFYRS
ncbi:DUF5050 domain-containing protein, partial [candidate division KSB1 bacterium]|nr:DUF5050 domain-containing protein [candidate division KSB1 bacterium]